MKKTIEVIIDSLTKEEIRGGFNETFVAVGDKGWTLQLTDESLEKLMQALEPFVEGEDTSVSPRDHYSTGRTSRVSAGTTTKTAKIDPATRAAIAKFVSDNNLGRVSERGRIKASFVQAWESAGKPGL